MATLYVSSVDGSDSDNGSTWALAKATIAGALAVATDSENIIYVDSSHNFAPTAAINWNPAADNIQVAIISVNRSTGAWLAGAAETVNVNAQAFSIGSTGTTGAAWKLFVFGMVITGNSGSSTNNKINIGTDSDSASFFVFRDCVLSTPGTSTNATLIFGGGSSFNWESKTFRFINCTLKLTDNVSGIPVSVQWLLFLRFENCVFQSAGTAKPTEIFSTTGTGHSTRAELIQLLNCNLTALDGGTAIVNVAGFTKGGRLEIVNSALGSGMTFTTGSWSSLGRFEVTAINCDSGDTNYKFRYQNRLGTLVESTSVYASDGFEFGGLTPLSWQIVTTSQCNEFEPFVTPWMVRWNDSTSAQTASLEVVHDSATALHDRNLWAEFEYLSNASYPLGTLASARNAQPFDGSSSNWGAGSATWTGTGGFSNENKQKVTKAFTAAEKSPLRGRLFVAAASKTLYLDPQERLA